ncbi:aspartyl/asparaginyl beta-hydroxylase domain-containing protein [Solimonas terrae]|uniref:Aspartyl/asparaginyl beta-hydroxylase domain-containing protein n=1 Tax=Solimonas terrae TaxID=1396819 RepID=A0A6M2BRN4_9GAMM|nr:aspartyl/asparaginyl beta-hydroxylase domain-containing protein [Solimonas terrae]NGY04689.1 aspartyl/asparaginyl beta-hydroxylase domain-containing protein [Solimonas terrae]
MNDSAQVAFDRQAADLDHRTHTLGSSRSLAARIGIHLQTMLERLVARVSQLPDTPVYDSAMFPWTQYLESQWRLIRAELDQVMLARERLPAFQQILDEVRTITTDDQWKTYWLLSAGMDCRENQARCPETTRLLRAIPGASTAFFSILAPGKKIPPHRGAYNGILRCHLAMIVPEPAQHVAIRVGNHICHWQEGRTLIFDDSFNHEVWNDTDGWRVVLFIDFARPLRQPWHLLNRAFLGIARFLPLLRRANRRHRDWKRGYYQAQP